MERVGDITFLGGCPGARLVSPPKLGIRHLAYPSGGPVDPEAYRAANLLVGNEPGAPVFELPLKGGKWRISEPTIFALTGADMSWSINGDQMLDRYTTVRITDSCELRGSYSRSGSYAYLALAGLRPSRPGPDNDCKLHRIQDGNCWRSKPSTDTLLFDVEEPVYPSRFICTNLLAKPGPEWDWLGSDGQNSLRAMIFNLSSVSSRHGLRLVNADDPGTLRGQLHSMISSPVLPGTVQLTPSGPIILGPDAQTVGGYPRILTLNTKALAHAYQVPLGGKIRFSLDR